MNSEVFKRALYLKKSKLIVVKVGTSSLTHESGLLNISQIDLIVRQLSDLHNEGYRIVVVTSGAIGAGMGKLGLHKKPDTIEDKQAAAAVGQGILLHMYEKIFSEYGLTIAQLLLTKEDIKDETRLNNAKNAFKSLLEKNVIPVVNENDAVVVDEIKFGDNDTLSAMVAEIINADLLIILSDINGMYDKDPKLCESAHLISRIEKITDEIEDAAGDSGSNLGTGGMSTKINAAKIATNYGAAVVIANSSVKNVLISIMHGENIGTWFQSPNENI